MRTGSIFMRRVPRSVAVGTAAAAALAAWAGASVVDSTDGATAKKRGGDRGKAAPSAAGKPKNVVVFIGDGMGPAQRGLIRLGGKGLERELAMDTLPVAGLQHTEPAGDALVTDSAASATAIATGEKTVNGAVGVDPEGRRLTSILERFERAGRPTGLVTTGQITDATPAAFGAHVDNRRDQTEIARQYLASSKPEVLLGGGEDWWLPAGTPGAYPDAPAADPSEGSRSDEGDLVARAKRQGYRYVSTRAGLKGAKGKKLLGLFANQEMFEQRPESDPNARYEPAVPLPEMTQKALDTLGAQSTKGFFLMVEEEAIDEMAHNNNAELTLRSGRALDDAVAVAKRYAAKHRDTLVLVTGDHETGGLALEEADAEDESGDGESAEDGPFAVPGTAHELFADWTTTGHTGVDVPVTAGGPGSGRFTGVYENTAIHDRLAEVTGLRR